MRKTAAQVREIIQANPGITVTEIARAAGVTPQTITYHVRTLARNGEIMILRQGNKRACFAKGAGLSAETRELTHFARGGTTLRVLEVLEQHPGVSRKRLSALVGLSLNGTVWHVKRLVSLGLVREEDAGGTFRLEVVPDKVARLRLPTLERRLTDSNH